MENKYSIKIAAVCVPMVFAALLIWGCSARKNSGVSFSGDFVPDGHTRIMAGKEGKAYFFPFIADIYSQYSFNVINLECPLTDKDKLPFKQYSFRADKTWGQYLKYAGVTHALLNNNHTLDCGTEGFTDTYHNLKQYGIVPVGENLSKEYFSLVYISLSNKPVVIVSSMFLNDTSLSGGGCSDSFRLESICRKIKELKQKKYFVFVTLHWGIEYLKIPSDLQKYQARKLIDSGADAIIGHHPHVVQQIGSYKGKAILYSLGNLVFSQRPPDTRKGIIAGFDISDDNSLLIKLYPYKISKGRPVKIESGDLSEFRKEIEYISPGVTLKDSEYGWDLHCNTEEAASLPDIPSSRPAQPAFPELFLKGKSLEGFVSLTKLNANNAYRVELKDKRGKSLNTVMFRNEIYRMESGDIDNDGNPEVILGVIKSSRFDPMVKRRLFILRIDNDALRPLWLGTQLCRELTDFHVIKDNNSTIVRTIEREKNNFYCTGEYSWSNFGLRLIKYTNQHLSFTKADEVLNRETKN